MQLRHMMQLVGILCVSGAWRRTRRPMRRLPAGAGVHQDRDQTGAGRYRGRRQKGKLSTRPGR